MQDDDAYDMATGNWRALRGRYPDHFLQEWRKRIGAPDQPTPERQAEIDRYAAFIGEFTPRDDEPDFVHAGIRLLGREHVERIAAKVYAEAFQNDYEVSG